MEFLVTELSTPAVIMDIMTKTQFDISCEVYGIRDVSKLFLFSKNTLYLKVVYSAIYDYYRDLREDGLIRLSDQAGCTFTVIKKESISSNQLKVELTYEDIAFFLSSLTKSGPFGAEYAIFEEGSIIFAELLQVDTDALLPFDVSILTLNQTIARVLDEERLELRQEVRDFPPFID